MSRLWECLSVLSLTGLRARVWLPACLLVRMDMAVRVSLIELLSHVMPIKIFASVTGNFPNIRMLAVCKAKKSKVKQIAQELTLTDWY